MNVGNILTMELQQLFFKTIEVVSSFRIPSQKHDASSLDTKLSFSGDDANMFSLKARSSLSNIASRIYSPTGGTLSSILLPLTFMLHCNLSSANISLLAELLKDKLVLKSLRR